MSSSTRLAAAALAAAMLGSWPAPAAAACPEELTARLDCEAGLLEARLVADENVGAAEDSPAARAQRRFEHGARRYELGDWLHAALALAAALDEPEWAGAGGRPAATFLLADALRRSGECGAARVRYDELLRREDAPERAAAIAGALECAVKEHRQGDVDRLLADAQRAFGASPPPEVRYLEAKAAYQRTDLAPEDRIRGAIAAFGEVGPPFQLQAWYFQGVLRIERQEPAAAVEWFERCARARPGSARDGDVRELCLLALGRVHAELGDAATAVRWYDEVPWSSPRFGEAVHETALAQLRAKRWDEALRMASFIPDLAPESPLAPEATLLRAHLLLRLGRWADATDAYGAVIDRWAPLRDELDAILAAREDPVRFFDELAGRQGAALEAGGVLPAAAVRWATSNPDVGAALALVREGEAARGEVRDARDVADRLERLLERGAGLDAFPALLRAYTDAQAVENDAARVEGAAAAAALAAAERGLPPAARRPLAAARQARAQVEARFERLPRSAPEIEERLSRLHGRVDRALGSATQLRFVIDGNRAAVAECEAWLGVHRSELASDDGRDEFGDELRKHRAVLDGYETELAELRRELEAVRDTAGGYDALVEEVGVREEYLAAVEREWAAFDGARPVLQPADRLAVWRLKRLRARLAAIREKAQGVEAAVAADAASRSGALRARIRAERGDLVAEQAALDALQQGSREVLGRIAVRSLADVRDRASRLVLEADVGLVDVAWSRKRQRLERIQTLAAQKDAAVEQLDREYRSVLREVE